MNLLDKYITAVGDHLPAKGRADIEAELRSTLQDMLDDRSAATGQPINDDMIKAVLKEYGAPAKVAATYQEPRYLVGPRLYPIFELVLRIVLAVIVGASLLNLAVSMVSTPSGPSFGAALWQFLGNALSGAVIAFGNIVLVFAVLERVLKDADYEKAATPWDPSELAAMPDSTQFKRLDLIMEVVFSVIGLIFLNVYVRQFGFGILVQGQWIIVKIFSEAFLQYLPWINGLAVLQIALNLIALRQNGWNTWTRAGSLIFRAGGVALAIAMITGPSIIALSPDSLAGTPLAEHVPQLGGLVVFGVSIGLLVSVIANSVQVVRGVYLLLRRRPGVAYPVMK
jgi:hypothetical protein